MMTCVMVLQVESNVKLEECLKKVQQENEDYKARMDKHAALSKYVLCLTRLSPWLPSQLPLRVYLLLP